MFKLQKIYSFLIIIVFNVNLAVSQNDNPNWPEDKTKPFSYPTKDPININTLFTRRINFSTPITFDSDPSQTSNATNTGYSLIIVPTESEENERAVITGGVLYAEVYKFFQTEFFWDIGLKFDVADSVNYIGSLVQVVVSYFNTKYGSKNAAIDKRDGVAQFVLFVYVSIKPNPDFVQFQRMLQSIKKAGTSTTISEAQSYAWYFQESSIDDYYAYPGQYVDLETGKAYDSATVIILRRQPQPSISYAQFKSTFGSFKNESGESYSHTSKQVNRGIRPVVHGNGLAMDKVKL